MKSEKKELFGKNHAQQQLKKPYTTPNLTVYGTVDKITEAGPGGQLELPF